MSDSKKIKMVKLFDAMWQDYLKLNPDAQAIYTLFSHQNTVVNDHIALRTFNLPAVNINTLARPLLANGYVAAGDYQFINKKLVAQHFQHTDPALPKVFISELLVEQFSAELQSTITGLIDQLTPQMIGADNFLHSGRPWQLSYRTYQQLLSESEYAAWVAAFGYRPNHFTVSVNHLAQFSTLEAVNRTLLESGFKMNSVNGLIKGSRAVGLQQSSTLANKTEVVFSDFTVNIPSCFYEFALRHKVDHKTSSSDGELFNGFVADSADKIFESTDVKFA
ncbi:MAG: hypothetical protein ACI8WB_006018 [Phenylobacterium sp.]|jgi:hypothetical protein